MSAQATAAARLSRVDPARPGPPDAPARTEEHLTRAGQLPTLPVGDITRETVERLSEALGDPAWLRERRLEAWATYERLPVPDTRSEAWRYTDLARVPWRATTVALDSPERFAATDYGGGEGEGAAAAAGLVQLVDGAAELATLGPEDAQRGVVFTDLLSAVRDHEELLERHLLRSGITPELGKLAALHCALLNGGVFLYVPRNVQVALPLRSLRSMAREGGAAFPHTLILAEEGSSVTYVEESRSPTREAPAMNCAAAEVVAGPASRVHLVTMQDWGRHVFHYSLQRTRIQRDAVVNSLVVSLGGRLSRVEVQSVLEAQGGTSEMLGLYLGDGEQHIDHHTLQLHQAPHTTSDLLFKGALRDRSRSAFSGLIKVFKGAQKTDAYQKNRNLLLSPEARADSLPNLEIEADDVRCSHGATIGAADELQLFYLASRGLRREDAERLLVLGFFEEVLARLPEPILRDRIREAFARKSAPGTHSTAAAPPASRPLREAAPEPVPRA